MVGYKIAYVTDSDGDFEVRYPALVILDIPDDADIVTPEKRYMEYELPRGRFPFNNWGNDRIVYITYKDHNSRELFSEYIGKMFEIHIVNRKYDCMSYFMPYSLDYDYDYTDMKTVQSFRDLRRFVHVSKCRTKSAKVVDIIGIIDNKHYDTAYSMFDYDFKYTVGENVTPDRFNYDPLDICGCGIHWFKTATLAILFALEEGFELDMINARFMIEQLGILLGNKGDCGENAQFYVRDEPYEEGDIDERT